MPETTYPSRMEAAEQAVLDKYTGEVLGRVPQHTYEQAIEVIAEAAAATRIASSLSRHERAAVLARTSTLLEDRVEVAATLIVREAGKTIRQARKEVARAANTLRLSSIEAQRNAGELIPFDSFAGSENRFGWFSREPLGLIVAITPYNDPLNLVAHKLGPAIAGGNSVILKPSQSTPLTAQFLVDLLVEAGLPKEVVSVVRGDRVITKALVQARPVRMVSFTGGFAAGAAIAADAGIKRLAMELGGNAPVIVFDDADLDLAVERCVSGAFWAAGQNCIGAQRILVHREVHDRFVSEFTAAASRLITGDPGDERTDVGPMISTMAAMDARAKIREAVEAGAKLLLGGEQSGPMFTPTVLTGVPHTCRVWADEVFAPIVSVEPFDDEASAIELANDVEYALQAGIFTTDLNRALRLAQAVDAGGVMINDSSDYRLDAMPFGGSKYGSMGREGVRFAYEEMTQTKVVAITR